MKLTALLLIALSLLSNSANAIGPNDIVLRQTNDPVFPYPVTLDQLANIKPDTDSKRKTVETRDESRRVKSMRFKSLELAQVAIAVFESEGYTEFALIPASSRDKENGYLWEVIAIKYL